MGRCSWKLTLVAGTRGLVVALGPILMTQVKPESCAGPSRCRTKVPSALRRNLLSMKSQKKILEARSKRTDACIGKTSYSEMVATRQNFFGTGRRSDAWSSVAMGTNTVFDGHRQDCTMKRANLGIICLSSIRGLFSPKPQTQNKNFLEISAPTWSLSEIDFLQRRIDSLQAVRCL